MPACRIATRLTLPLAVALVAACGGDPKPASSSPGATAQAAPAADLTPFQLKHGIGPITEEVVLAAADPALAKQGATLFEQKCSACHKMGEKYVGPPLGGIVQKVGPTFVMNMMLNPEGMYSKHPDVKKLLAEYMTQMPNQQLTPEQARAIVEHLRSEK